MQDFSRLITGFAGQGVILPIVVCVAALLLMAGQNRAALWWVISVCLVLGLMLLAKLAFIPCGRYLPGIGLRSPSGHATSAMAVYGGLAVLLTRMGLPRRARWIALAIGLLVALLISASRVFIGAHTPAESAFGTAIGLIAPAILETRKNLFTRTFRIRWMLLVIVPVLLALLLRNVEVDAEHEIDHFAFAFSLFSGLCR